MPWLWTSFEEYRDRVRPVEIADDGHWRTARSENWHWSHGQLLEMVSKVEEGVDQLKRWGFAERPDIGERDTMRPPGEGVLTACCIMVRDIEVLFLYHRRLALTEAADEVIRSKDIEKHWPRYCTTPYRAYKEVADLIAAVQTLLSQYYALVRSDERVLAGECDELPDEWITDIALAQHLLSVGFDDVALFIAGRGFETVLRQIVREKELTVVANGKALDQDRLTFFHLIEALGKAELRARGVPAYAVLTVNDRSLLHYVRSLRNAGAHAKNDQTRFSGSDRELAIVLVRLANQLWLRLNKPGHRLVSRRLDIRASE